MSGSKRRKRLLSAGAPPPRTPPPAAPANHQTVAVSQVRTQIFHGPLPHPELLEKYDKVVPGLAERIITLTENQASHRQYLERKVIDADVIAQYMGQVFGFILGLVGIGGGIFLASRGLAVFGTIFGGASLSALVGVFVYGARKRSRERAQKHAQMTR